MYSESKWASKMEVDQNREIWDNLSEILHFIPDLTLVVDVMPWCELFQLSNHASKYIAFSKKQLTTFVR